MIYTQWFTKDKPQHIGVYQVKEDSGWIAYAYWNGRKFGFRIDVKCGCEKDAIKAAYKHRKQYTVLGSFAPWRGVAK